MPADSPAQPSPFDTVMQLAGGYSVSRCLHVVADLGLADALDDAPRSAAELAQATGTNADALARVLRLLSAFGIFESRGTGFAHTPASRMLRTDHPQSLRAFVQMIGLPMHWVCYGDLHYSVRTGLPASDKLTTGGVWKYYSDRPEVARIFNQAMIGKAHGQVAAIVRDYDFSRFKRIADIGGGRGHLLSSVLAATPKATGVLFDLPHSIGHASGIASDRLQLQPGDFFTDNMPVCDAYMIMDVIHDWNDEDSLKILKNLRRAAPPNSALLLIEAIILEDARPSQAKLVDITMLSITGGRQRTQKEFAKMLAQAGFRFERQIDVANFSILEAVAS